MTAPYLPPEEGFLGVPAEDAPARPQDAKCVVIPFGLERSVSYGGGAGRGPAAMLEASHQVELFDEEFWREPFREYGVATLAEPAIPDDAETALALLETMVEEQLAAGKFPFVFGGEHSISAGAIRPFARRYQDLTILHFDAHADLRDGYDGDHFSHAAALRRCLDFPHVRLISVGIRNISQSEIPFLEQEKDRITIFWAKDRQSWNFDTLKDLIRGRTLYVTFDVDGFDASLMPATGTPEPGGLFWDEALRFIREGCSVAREVVGADVNELAPKPDLHGCDFTAAKLAYKIASYALAKRS